MYYETINVYYKTQTAKGIGVTLYEGDEPDDLVWLPKSQIEVVDPPIDDDEEYNELVVDTIIEVLIPDWLYERVEE